MKVKIILTLLFVIAIAGCGGTSKTPPWDKSDIDKMGEDTVTIWRYDF